MDYVMGFIAILVTVGVYMNFTFGLIQRLLNLAVLYMISPLTIAFYPFDEGAKFKSKFIEPFQKEVVGAYAIVISLNLFFVVFDTIKYEVTNMFKGMGNVGMGMFFGLITVISLVSMLTKVRTMLNDVLGGADVEKKSLGEVYSSAKSEAGSGISSAAGLVKNVGGDLAKGREKLGKLHDFNLRRKMSGHQSIIGKAMGQAKSTAGLVLGSAGRAVGGLTVGTVKGAIKGIGAGAEGRKDANAHIKSAEIGLKSAKANFAEIKRRGGSLAEQKAAKEKVDSAEGKVWDAKEEKVKNFGAFATIKSAGGGISKEYGKTIGKIKGSGKAYWDKTVDGAKNLIPQMGTNILATGSAIARGDNPVGNTMRRFNSVNTAKVEKDYAQKTQAEREAKYENHENAVKNLGMAFDKQDTFDRKKKSIQVYEKMANENPEEAKKLDKKAVDLGGQAAEKEELAKQARSEGNEKVAEENEEEAKKLRAEETAARSGAEKKRSEGTRAAALVKQYSAEIDNDEKAAVDAKAEAMQKTGISPKAFAQIEAQRAIQNDPQSTDAQKNAAAQKIAEISRKNTYSDAELAVRSGGAGASSPAAKQAVERVNEGMKGLDTKTKDAMASPEMLAALQQGAAGKDKVVELLQEVALNSKNPGSVDTLIGRLQGVSGDVAKTAMAAVSTELAQHNRTAATKLEDESSSRGRDIVDAGSQAQQMAAVTGNKLAEANAPGSNIKLDPQNEAAMNAMKQNLEQLAKFGDDIKKGKDVTEKDVEASKKLSEDVMRLASSITKLETTVVTVGTGTFDDKGKEIMRQETKQVSVPMFSETDKSALMSAAGIGHNMEVKVETDNKISSKQADATNFANNAVNLAATVAKSFAPPPSSTPPPAGGGK
jgi:hypothetical protein